MSLEVLDVGQLSEDTGTADVLFSIEVTFDVGNGRTPLLGAASVLHRRGIDIVGASLTMDRSAAFRFAAQFRCRPAQARTVFHTFGNRVDTRDVKLIQYPTDHSHNGHHSLGAKRRPMDASAR